MELILNIVGEKIALGPLRRDLVPVYRRWFNDFAVVRSLAIPPRPMTLEEETAWYELAAAGDPSTVSFTVYEWETERPIGMTMWRDIDFRNRTAEYAIVIGEADARGKGYGTEATRLMVDYAFTALGLHSVMLSCYAFNIAGQRAYQRAGFREIGRRREAHWMGGRLWDEIFMDCLASEFASPVLARVFAPDAPRAVSPLT